MLGTLSFRSCVSQSFFITSTRLKFLTVSERNLREGLLDGSGGGNESFWISFFSKADTRAISNWGLVRGLGSYGVG